MRTYAKKEFTYNGVDLERGEIFELIGARNDQKLLAMGHCEKLAKKLDTFDCTCGKSFAVEHLYHRHLAGNKHPKEALAVSSA